VQAAVCSPGRTRDGDSSLAKFAVNVAAGIDVGIPALGESRLYSKSRARDGQNRDMNAAAAPVYGSLQAHAVGGDEKADAKTATAVGFQGVEVVRPKSSRHEARGAEVSVEIANDGAEIEVVGPELEVIVAATRTGWKRD
jgi:hypothetical protein